MTYKLSIVQKYEKYAYLSVQGKEVDYIIQVVECYVNNS